MSFLDVSEPLPLWHGCSSCSTSGPGAPCAGAFYCVFSRRYLGVALVPTDISSRLVEWNDRLALDIALVLENSGDTIDGVLEDHNIDKETLARFNKDPIFLKRVSDLRMDVREKGLTFRLKARMQAEELLTTSWDIIHDADTSAAVRADLIKSTVKWAGYEQKDPSEIAGGGGGVKITINLGPQEPKTIEG